MKMSILLQFFVILHLIYSAQFKVLQERAMILSYDPKYVKDPQAFTARIRRGDAYKSNISLSMLQPWGNNVTFSMFYVNKRTGNDLIFESKCCDVFTWSWLADFIWSYLQLKKTCPIPKGRYSIKNLELPPKNYPLPLPKGEVQIIWSFTLTATRHSIVKISIKLKT